MQERILGWYRVNGRELAWRATTKPYRILVSEIMLQQTQAARVQPAYRTFLARFPTVRALASAPAADVLRAWRGLGYNRRALALHRAAQIIVERHGGRVPADLGALRELPGVGEYTARAVLSFAFGRDAAPVDTNVARVLTRAVAGRRLPPRELQALADDLLPPGSAPEWNAALMDLGASHCSGRAPHCERCPLEDACVWHGQGGPDPWATAGQGPQSTFPGSDRYHRGRLLDALRAGAVHAANIAVAAQLEADPERAHAVTDGLVRDGLAVQRDGWLRLPA